MYASASSPPLLLTVLVSLVAVVPTVYCLFDISRHPDTRQLTAPAWMLICAFGNIFGVIAYVVYGRDANR
ncbi:PLD nuclease N-terminal domain-containing protein [Streptomyces sp. NPDC001663]|uniref:PLD nuclease N-terminal domain-containing protein n=1 Tax=Streptomyces sp. NPDC001663 TaxID=3364597 RepID=UPI0036A16ED2